MKAKEYRDIMNYTYATVTLEMVVVKNAKLAEEKAKSEYPTAYSGLRFTSPGAYKSYMNGGMK